MISGYDELLGASAEDRRDLFIAASRRLGTVEQNVEKDFWVCWTLDVLFNRLPPGGPRLLFKGGTSLSKAFGLISRFSEDIDVTVFRHDLGEDASVQALEGLSGKKRKATLDAIKAACQAFIAGPLRSQMIEIVEATLNNAKITVDGPRIELDAEDADRQTLLFRYPSVTVAKGGYVRPAVKIESGAKSALDPNHPVAIRPYLADDVANLDLLVTKVTTVDAERTFWDKVVILHGLRRWFDRRGVLRGGGQRVSRHFYDIHCLMGSSVGARALANAALGRDCVQHARMFFNSADLDLASAESGRFTLIPNEPMLAALRRDYEAMAGMIFGDVPAFNALMKSVAELEAFLNSGSD